MKTPNITECQDPELNTETMRTQLNAINLVTMLDTERETGVDLRYPADLCAA